MTACKLQQQLTSRLGGIFKLSFCPATGELLHLHAKWKDSLRPFLNINFILSVRQQVNRPFAASHSRGTKLQSWIAKVALGQDKQRKLPFKIMYGFCLSCPSATFAIQHGSFVPSEWRAAKDLLKYRCLAYPVISVSTTSCGGRKKINLNF